MAVAKTVKISREVKLAKIVMMTMEIKISVDLIYVMIVKNLP